MEDMRKLMKNLFNTPSKEASKKPKKKQSKEQRKKIAMFKLGFSGKKSKYAIK